MRPGFQEFLELPKRDQEEFFQVAASDFGTLGSHIEKDFWVSLVLNALFEGLPENYPRLSFKGGTSLSKIFGLIQRFSEDIDITVSRADLGFSGERDPADGTLGLKRKRREELLEQLRAEVSTYARDSLKPSLIRAIGPLHGDLQIENDPDDPDDATLLVYYPKLVYEGSPEYVKPYVKIELGARAAEEPCTGGQASPYVHRLTPEMNMVVPNIRTVLAERTFWEKILILHGWQCRFRDRDESVADRHRPARHYYDVALLSQTSICENAIADLRLLDRVRDHNNLMFRRAWAKSDEARPGSFRIAPKEKLLHDIERDYVNMVDMVLGEAPPFERIIEKIKQLEEKLNALQK